MGWTTLVSNLATAAVNGAVGYAQQQKQNQFNAEQAEKARKETFALNEQAANNADARTRALFSDLYSPEAQMNQYREAGINPSLMLSHGLGGSGSSGAQGGAGSASASSSGMFNLGLDLLQAQKVGAEIEAMKEDTRGKKIKNDSDQEWMNKTAEETYNKLKAEVKGQQIANDIADLDLYIKDMTAESSIQEIIARAVQISNEANISGINYDIAEETKETTIKMAEAGYEKLLSEIRVNNQNIKLSKAEIRKMEYEMKLEYNKLLWDIYDIQQKYKGQEKDRELQKALAKYNGKIKLTLQERQIESEYNQLFIKEGFDTFQAFLDFFKPTPITTKNITINNPKGKGR